MNFDYHGITFCDISTHQDSPQITGTVDFHKMKAYGFRAVCLRATNGIYEDVDFQKYRTNVADIIPWFAYHYYNNLYTPKQQAQKFFDVLAPNMPPVVVLDLEDKGTGYKGWRHWYDWLVEFQRLSGLPDDRIWIYTNEYYFGDESGPITQAQKDWFKRFSLWLASYSRDPFHPPYALIEAPDPWDVAIALQSGTPAIGLEAGVESLDLDYDQFNGDETKFNEIFGTSTEPEPPDTEVGMRYFDIKGAMNIRSSPAVIASPSNDIGDLLAGDKIEISETITVSATDRWGKLFKITRAGVSVVLPASTCYVSLNTTNTVETFPLPTDTKSVTVTVELEGYKPLTLSGEMEPL